MALVPHKITALAESDEQGTDGKNIVAGAIVVLYDTSGEAAVLYDDENGANGSTVKQTDAKGQVVVYVEQGEYDEQVNGSTLRRVLIGSAKGTITSYATTAELESTRPNKTGQRAENRERANAQYVLAAAGYVAQPGDITAANGRVWQLQVSGAANAKWFGLMGNRDETAKLQEIADWLDQNKSVYFEDDFSLTSTVTFSNGGTVDFGSIVIDGTGLPNSTVERELNTALFFTGSLEGSVAIDADIQAGSSSFTSAAAGGISKGDTVIVRSDQLFVDEWDGSSNAKRGEILTIASVSGGVYEVAERFKFSYAQASNLRVEKMNPIKCTIKGGTVQMGGVGSEHRGVQIIYGRNCIIDDLTVKGAEDTSVSISHSHTVNYKGECRDATTPSSGFNTGYGVACVNGSRNINVDVIGHNCKHLVTSGGELPSLETRVKGVAYDCGITSTAFDCHEPCFGWDWDVECYGGMAGIGIRGSEQKVKIKARNLRSSAVRVRTFGNAGRQYNIDVNVDSDSTDSTAVSIGSNDCPLNDVKISGIIRNTLINGVSAVGNSTFGISNLYLNLDCDNSSSRAFDVRFAEGVKGAVKCRNSGEIGLQIFDSSNISLTVDVESEISNAAVLLRVLDCEINGPRAYSGSQASIVTNDCANIDIGVKIIDAVGSTSDGWRAIDTVGGKLIGSNVSSGRHGIFSSGTSDNFIVSLNNAINVTSANKFNLSGVNNVEANNLA